MSTTSRTREERRHPVNDDATPFRMMLIVLALSTIAMSIGVLLATVVHI